MFLLTYTFTYCMKVTIHSLSVVLARLYVVAVASWRDRHWHYSHIDSLTSSYHCWSSLLVDMACHCHCHSCCCLSAFQTALTFDVARFSIVRYYTAAGVKVTPAHLANVRRLLCKYTEWMDIGCAAVSIICNPYYNSIDLTMAEGRCIAHVYKNPLQCIFSMFLQLFKIPYNLPCVLQYVH